jgi:hypothetical protein
VASATCSFILLACAECEDSLPFSGSFSIPLCYIPFPSTKDECVFNTLASTHMLCFAVPYNYIVLEFHTSYMSVLVDYRRRTVHIVFVGLIYKIWLHIHPGLVLCLFGLYASCQFTQLLNLHCQFIYAKIEYYF